jgi:GTPase Era involved in 16S rRNA processing
LYRRACCKDETSFLVFVSHTNDVKEIDQMARGELEAATNKKVFLELEAEVDPHWVERL